MSLGKVEEEKDTGGCRKDKENAGGVVGRTTVF